MKKTKLLSMFMAGVLASTMVSTVVAADPLNTLEAGATGSSVVAQGSTELPTISVTMPTEHGFKINPYKIGDADSQIDSTVAKIINNSDVAIDVQLKSAAVTFGGTAKVKPSLVTKESISTSTVKGVYLELVYENVTKKQAEIEAATFGGEPKVVPITTKVVPTSLAKLAAPTGDLGSEDIAVLLLKYDGQTVLNPASGWDASDTVTVTSVYSFTVAAAE